MTRAITIYRSMRVMELLDRVRCYVGFRIPIGSGLRYSPAEAGRSSGRRLAARFVSSFEAVVGPLPNAPGDVPMTATMSARRQSSALASVLSALILCQP